MTYEYDFFISYAETDAAWVHGYLKTSLERAGKHCFTVEDFRLGHPELLEIERAIQQSHRILLVLSPEYLNNSEHISSILDSLAQYRGKTANEWPVIPLLLRDVTLPPRLDFLVGLDFSDETSRYVYLKRLLDSANVPFDDPELRPDSPYPGLRAYKESESNFFFGRDQAIQDLLSRLRKTPLVTVVGASGSGKSSLIYAGLIPQLYKSSMFGSKDWCIKTMRPSLDAITALEEHLPKNFLREPENEVQKLLKKNSAQNLLFFIDQFEEVFSQPELITRKFFKAVEELNNISNVYIVITLRADFFHQIMSLSIWSLVEKNQYNLLPLNKENLKEVIRKPAIHSGVFIDDLLIEKIVNDAAGEPGILPFIQETMNLLWDKLQYHYLPAEVYDDLKLRSNDGKTIIAVGLKAAIALHAEATYNGLDQESRNIAKQIFVQLVQFGIGRSDIRRQQTFADLCPDKYLNEFTTTIHYFANDRHRLLTLSGDGSSKNRKVDLAHESLLTAWPRLKEWIESSKESEKTRRRLVNKAKEWLELDKKGGFLDKLELKKVDQWLTENPLLYINDSTLDFIESSKKQIHYKLLKLIIILLLPVILYFSGLNLYRIFLKQKAIQLAGKMILLEPKKIKMGRPEFEGRSISPSWTTPWHSSYKMDKHEVSNEEFCLCIQADICTPLADYNPCQSKESLPIVNISLKSADQYCKWLSKRLPHEAEFEYAARNLEKRLDSTKEKHKLNIMKKESELEPEPVGMNKTDIAKHEHGNINDLLGNVAEWTLTQYKNYSEINDTWKNTTISLTHDQVVVRGGSFQQPTDKFLSSIRSNVEPNVLSEDIGFRCVSNN